MPVVSAVASGESYDLILVGTGFASTFFLHRYLQQASAATRVLVLERGALHEHRWQVQHAAELERESAQSFQNRTPKKPWIFRVAVGGSSNCWWACTPRMLPEDFELATRYGIGRDWPVTYDQLEYYYGEAEALMSVSGASDGSPAPRSRPFPLPPHRFTDPDRLLKRHFPDEFFPQPTARPSRATAARKRCCASGICEACPIDSKFTILNTLRHLYEDDPRVTLLTGARVDRVDVVNGVATGVRYATGSGERVARGALVGLGANAIFNPTILLRSGLTAGPVGIGLMEQVSAVADIDLDGVENFQGSTSITGLGYMLYSGRNRGVKAAAIMESWNVPRLRPERGKWRQFLSLKFIFEALPRPENRVLVDTSDAVRPVVTYDDHGPTTERGLVDLEADLARVLAALPVERFTVGRTSQNTEAHVLGTTTMGHNPSESVVDDALVHHRVRNLLVLGGSVFPTAAPCESNPHHRGAVAASRRSAAGMTRRKWLLAVGGLAVSVWWWRPRPHDPASHLRAYFPYLRLSDGAVDGFVRDFTTFYGWFPVGSLPDKVSMQFLQSTDFFKHGADEKRTIEYASFYDPKITACYNPFAQFD